MSGKWNGWQLVAASGTDEGAGRCYCFVLALAIAFSCLGVDVAGRRHQQVQADSRVDRRPVRSLAGLVYLTRLGDLMTMT